MPGLQWRCRFAHTINSLRIHVRLFSIDFVLATPPEINYFGFLFSSSARMYLHRIMRHCFFRSWSLACAFSMIVCVVLIWWFFKFLLIFTFFTEVTDGPHTIVQEHTPNCFSHKKLSNLLVSCPLFKHMFWMIRPFHVFNFIAECVKFNRWISSKFRCWCQSYPRSARAMDAGFSVCMYAVFPRWIWRTLTFIFFLAVMWWIALGFTKLCHLWGLCRNLCFSLCLAQDVVAPDFSQAVLPRYLSLRLSSFIASGPSFLLSTQRPYSGFLTFAETCSMGILPDRLDMFVVENKIQGLWSFEFSSSHHCGVLQTFSILNVLSVHCFEQFLGRVVQSFPGSHRKAYRLLLIELDPIERRNLGQRHSVKIHWTNLRVHALHHELRLLESGHRSCK